MSATEQYRPLVLEGRADDLAALFDDEPSIDDPLAGRVHGREAFARFVPQAHVWLSERQARLEPLLTTHTDARTIAEYNVHLNHEGQQIALPVAVVGDHPNGRLRQVRVYHSMWPLIGAHRVRDAILSMPSEHEPLRDVIKQYQDALAAGDVEAIVSTFEPDGYFREPAGGEHVHRGTDQLRAFMAGLFSVGGITLEHCTITDDGRACAIEFNAVAFGTNPLIPQAGVAVYERGTNGKLHAARIYDDVNVEAFAGQR